MLQEEMVGYVILVKFNLGIHNG